jgi:hypothetical protein
VSLAASEKTESSGGPGSGQAASSGDCRNGDSRWPQFQIVIFFDAPAAPATSGSGTTPPQGGSAPVSQPPTGGSQ